MEIKDITMNAYEYTAKNGIVYEFVKMNNHYVAFKKEPNVGDTSITVNTTSVLNFIDTLEIDSELTVEARSYLERE
jgi:hypothetical protein